MPAGRADLVREMVATIQLLDEEGVLRGMPAGAFDVDISEMSVSALRAHVARMRMHASQGDPTWPRRLGERIEQLRREDPTPAAADRHEKLGPWGRQPTE